MEELYVIWSHEHSRWWGHARRGYVGDVWDAGAYSREEAFDICSGTGWNNGNVPNEVPVRLDDVKAVEREFTSKWMSG